MSNIIKKYIKKSRDTPLQDIPINFPKLENLHLELIEVKDKLKLNLPPIPRSKPKLNPLIVVSPTHNINNTIKNIEKFELPKSSPENKDNETIDIEIKNPKNHRAVHKKQHIQKDKSSSERDPEDISIMKELGTGESTEIDADEAESAAVEESSGKNDEDANGLEDEEYDIYAGLTPEERAAKEHEEYEWRFRILKKQYGRTASIPIPEFNEHSDLNTMKKTYERTIRELYLDEAVDNYRTYLIAGWVCMEYVCVQWLQVDLRGFTNKQIRMMYRYDRYLIELGEKSYSRWGMNLPVEIRLLGFILLQAGIFYLGKILKDKYGQGVSDVIDGLTGQPPDGSPAEVDDDIHSEAEESEKRVMRGPKLSAEDIRKRSQQANRKRT